MTTGIADHETFETEAINSSIDATELNEMEYYEDSSLNETEVNDGDEDDPGHMLNVWLGELNNSQSYSTLTKNNQILVPADDNHKSNAAIETQVVTLRKKECARKSASNSSTFNTQRCSLIDIENSPDNELEAILGELSNLETQFDAEMTASQMYQQKLKSSKPEKMSMTVDEKDAQIISKSMTIFHSQSSITDNNCCVRGDDNGSVSNGQGGGSVSPSTSSSSSSSTPTGTTDNDSAFCDNVSVMSSCSSYTATTGNNNKTNNINPVSVEKHFESEFERQKSQKIQLALKKIREASIKKLFIKVYTHDGSARSLLVDEKMSVSQVTRFLAEKFMIKIDTRWALVELIPDLYMERVYEDHENIVENCLMWKDGSKNTLWFIERPEKFDFVVRPELYLLGTSSSQRGDAMDEHCRQQLLDEYFNLGSVGAPEIEGYIWLKSENKKTWKKMFFILRSSGLYYTSKGGKKSSKDLTCLVTFDVNQVYYGACGWRKKYKAPTIYCFALKSPRIQIKSPRSIRYLCVDTESELHRWVSGIRIAKNGRKLYQHFCDIEEEMTHVDIDILSAKRLSTDQGCVDVDTISPVKSIDSALASDFSSHCSLSSNYQNSHENSRLDIDVFSSTTGEGGGTIKKRPTLIVGNSMKHEHDDVGQNTTKNVVVDDVIEDSCPNVRVGKGGTLLRTQIVRDLPAHLDVSQAKDIKMNGVMSAEYSVSSKAKIKDENDEKKIDGNNDDYELSPTSRRMFNLGTTSIPSRMTESIITHFDAEGLASTRLTPTSEESETDYNNDHSTTVECHEGQATRYDLMTSSCLNLPPPPRDESLNQLMMSNSDVMTDSMYIEDDFLPPPPPCEEEGEQRENDSNMIYGSVGDYGQFHFSRFPPLEQRLESIQEHPDLLDREEEDYGMEDTKRQVSIFESKTNKNQLHSSIIKRVNNLSNSNKRKILQFDDTVLMIGNDENDKPFSYYEHRPSTPQSPQSVGGFYSTSQSDGKIINNSDSEDCPQEIQPTSMPLLPPTFMTDLQRIVNKRWQTTQKFAQQDTLDDFIPKTGHDLHSALAFQRRKPPNCMEPTNNNRCKLQNEEDVQNWVLKAQPHYENDGGSRHHDPPVVGQINHSDNRHLNRHNANEVVGRSSDDCLQRFIPTHFGFQGYSPTEQNFDQNMQIMAANEALQRSRHHLNRHSNPSGYFTTSNHHHNNSITENCNTKSSHPAVFSRSTGLQHLRSSFRVPSSHTVPPQSMTVAAGDFTPVVHRKWFNWSQVISNNGHTSVLSSKHNVSIYDNNSSSTTSISDDGMGGGAQECVRKPLPPRRSQHTHISTSDSNF